ncbi:MAG: class I SAM-dependent methyltransferase [Ferruginibacter sp.]
MKIIAFIRYFFYLAYNWNPGIAWEIIRQEYRGEKKYGIDTTGTDELKALQELDVDISHATIYMPATYSLLEQLFNEPHIQSCTHLLDIGCGKGRILCVAAKHHFKKVTGVDFSRALCNAAIINLEIIKTTEPELNYEVKTNDAFYFPIATDVDCIFLFNPFDEVILSGVLENIEKSLAKKPRQMTLAYLNPVHKNILLASGFKQVFHTVRMQYLEAAVYEKSPGKTGA